MAKFKVWVEVEQIDEDADDYETIDGGSYAGGEFDTKEEAFAAMDRLLEIAPSMEM